MSLIRSQTFKTNLVLIHRVDCHCWNCSLPIREKYWGDCDFFPFNGNLKNSSSTLMLIGSELYVKKDKLQGCVLLQLRCHEVTNFMPNFDLTKALHYLPDIS